MKYELATTSWDEKEFAAIQRVLEDEITTMWDKTRLFECQFAAYVGAKYCVMVNSGSSANLLMVASLFYRQNDQLKRGDEVVVPAVSWPTSYYPLYQYGLKLKFVDIDLQTLNYDLKALENAVSDRTRMIMAVNLLGNPNDFAEIKRIIGDRDIILIEDNCESMGAVFEGKQAGTWGLMGTYSSFFSHHISTMEGGMIVTDDEELHHILLCLRAHGWTRNLPKENRVCSSKSDDKFSEYFRFVLPGYNVRPIEMMGAIGSEQIKKLTSFIEHRRKNADYFMRKFGDSPFFHVQKEIGTSSWFGFSLIIKPGVPIDRKTLVNYLIDHEIDTRPIVAGNFTKNKVIEFFDCELSGEMTNAIYLDEKGFFVGNHQFEITDKIDYLVSIINKFVREKGIV